MRYALPPGESAIVERFVFACLALGVGAVAAFVAIADADLFGLRAPLAIPREAETAVLGMLFLAYATTFALVAAGSLPPERRLRLGLSIVFVAVAAAAAPMSYFEDLPDAWQRPDVHATLAMVPALALGLGVAFAAPARGHRWAWMGAALIWTYALLHRIESAVAATGALDGSLAMRAWRIVAVGTLVLGMVVVAGAYARGLRRKDLAK